MALNLKCTVAMSHLESGQIQVFKHFMHSKHFAHMVSKVSNYYSTSQNHSPSHPHIKYALRSGGSGGFNIDNKTAHNGRPFFVIKRLIGSSDQKYHKSWAPVAEVNYFDKTASCDEDVNKEKGIDDVFLSDYNPFVNRRNMEIYKCKKFKKGLHSGAIELKGFQSDDGDHQCSHRSTLQAQLTLKIKMTTIRNYSLEKIRNK
ncbi:hypothetical protein HELRODRAFT_175971 [Helobdella robusta]|uniref:Uncharacterized protein n=1 Tax=Helobdella robusta TaxID=6412 RepID=T1F9Z4_HELRO|nr:hypothetical protein HELRODRAFT_175971 [Helobdella robusta]ESO00150.1 hypothetical protein HELRODRAFT_175971 [Helobdella robusta]